MLLGCQYSSSKISAVCEGETGTFFTGGQNFIARHSLPEGKRLERVSTTFEVECLAFLGGSGRLLAGGAAGLYALWMKGGKLGAAEMVFKEPISTLCGLGGSARVACGLLDGGVRVLSFSSMLASSLPVVHEAGRVLLVGGEGSFFSAGEDCLLIKYDSGTLRSLDVAEIPEPPTALAIANQPSQLFVASQLGSVFVFETEGLVLSKQVKALHQSPIISLAVKEDGVVLALAADGRLRFPFSLYSHAKIGVSGAECAALVGPNELAVACKDGGLNVVSLPVSPELGTHIQAFLDKLQSIERSSPNAKENVKNALIEELKAMHSLQKNANVYAPPPKPPTNK